MVVIRLSFYSLKEKKKTNQNSGARTVNKQMHGIDGDCAVTWLFVIMGGKQHQVEAPVSSVLRIAATRLRSTYFTLLCFGMGENKPVQ